jgi:hypothetical protein
MTGLFFRQASVLPVIHCRQSCRQPEDDGDPIRKQVIRAETLIPEITENSLARNDHWRCQGFFISAMK